MHDFTTLFYSALACACARVISCMHASFAESLTAWSTIDDDAKTFMKQLKLVLPQHQASGLELELRHTGGGGRGVLVERQLTRLKQEIQQLTEMQYCYMAVLDVRIVDTIGQQPVKCILVLLRMSTCCGCCLHLAAW